jgi:hypothetical protein
LTHNLLLLARLLPMLSKILNSDYPNRQSE